MIKRLLIALVLASTFVSIAPAAPTQASEDETCPVDLLGASLLAVPEIYPLIFPVLGPNYFSDTWGHAATDAAAGTSARTS